MSKFFNREKEIKELNAILSSEPTIIYFVYGPINSGKTALLNKVIENLSDSYRVFYINFRRIETRRYEDFLRALFEVKEEGLWEKIKNKSDLVAAAVEFGEKVARKINNSFVLPLDLMKTFLKKERLEGKDCFRYLENLMKYLVNKAKYPVLILDELQMLKEIKGNGLILHDLFNFLVAMTKETHLCHCFAATSDCLFIEEIYSSAKLKGRADTVF